MNHTNNNGETAGKLCLQYCEKVDKEEVLKVLHAAGEIGEELQNNMKDPHVYLANFCREAIRKQLLKMSQENLFVRVPKLGLPKPLQKFLLYNVSLDDTAE